MSNIGIGNSNKSPYDLGMQNHDVVYASLLGNVDLKLDEAEAETTKKPCPSQASTVGAAKGKAKTRKRKRDPILLFLSGNGKYSSLSVSGEITLHLPRKRRRYIYLYFFGALQTPTKRTSDDQLSIIDYRYRCKAYDRIECHDNYLS